ncbi:MAG TPA: GNAT family N-acetyltransferase [Myxococcaceae bacterium]|nr:GNAT family N-acetyltransferase [Myxococcaceae bacterium]
MAEPSSSAPSSAQRPPVARLGAAPGQVSTAPAASGEDRVIALADRASFAALEDPWNALVEATSAQPFHRHEFIRIWIDNFAPRQPLRILAVQDGRGGLTGALPLLERRSHILGMPVRQLAAAANVHSCRFDLIASEPERAARALFAHLAADRSWDMLQLSDVPEGGNAWHLFRAAQQAGFPVASWESMRSPYIPLPASMAELEGALPAKFRSNLRRRLRKLEWQGRVSLERVSGGLELEGKLEEGFSLERSGWKGESGTAIAQHPTTRGFYSELSRTAAHRGYLSLFFLRLNGRPVAFHYALSCGGRYFLLKPTYSERWSESGPGQLLVREVLSDCIGRGIQEFDFLGPNMSWKQDWTVRARRHTWLMVFRDSAFGRALCRARFDWIPGVRRVVQRWVR